MKKIVYTFLICLFCLPALAQKDTTSVFQKMEETVNNFKLDTSAVPEDNLTKKIRELRYLRGGYNINEVIAYNIVRESRDQNISAENLDQIVDFFQTGPGKKWLDNAVIHIYRNHFSYDEIKDLIKFYKSPTGRKFSQELPLIMMESVRAAELIKDEMEKRLKE